MKAPAWLNEIRPDSCLNARDVCSLLGGISLSKLDQMIIKGSFPAEDKRIGCKLTTSDRPRTPSREWFVKTVIRYFKGLPG